jgi:hypothetical protein
MEMLAMSSDDLEVVSGGIPSFDQMVREKFKNCCGNCGGAHKLAVKMVVPEEAGGQEVASNGILICRACEMATEAASRGEASERRPVNFWVSRRLHDRMLNGMRAHLGFKSMGALVRYLMSLYGADPTRFDDLDRYQDSSPGEVKINVWVPYDQYELFKVKVNGRGLSVTDAVKSMILLFDAEVPHKS